MAKVLGVIDIATLGSDSVRWVFDTNLTVLAPADTDQSYLVEFQLFMVKDFGSEDHPEWCSNLGSDVFAYHTRDIELEYATQAGGPGEYLGIPWRVVVRPQYMSFAGGSQLIVPASGVVTATLPPASAPSTGLNLGISLGL